MVGTHGQHEGLPALLLLYLMQGRHELYMDWPISEWSQEIVNHRNQSFLTLIDILLRWVRDLKDP